MHKLLIILLMELSQPTDGFSQSKEPQKKTEETGHTCEIVRTDMDWRKRLTPEEYEVLIKKGTEHPFTGKYVHNKENGVYQCAACENELFASDTKFDSGTGWPSFWSVISSKNVKLNEDNAYGMKRTEVVCAKCGSHLGHVFDDGPKPTGLRFCINSVSLKFKPKTN